MLRPHRLHRLRILGLPVLDVLRLVEHDGIEFQPAIFFRIATDERVAGHDQIAGGDVGEAGVPVGPVQRQNF